MVLLLIAWYTKGDIKRVIWTYPNQPETIFKYILSIYGEPSVEHKNYENKDSFAQSWVASKILSISDSTTLKGHYNTFTCWASMDFDPHGDPAMPSVGTESQNPCAGHGKKTVHNNAVSVCIPREILKMKQKQLEIDNQQVRSERRGGASQFSPTISRVTSYSFILTR